LAESHVLSALKQKRATVSGQIIAAERLIGELRATLVHLDGAMRLFAGDEINPEAIPPKLPRPIAALPTAMPRGDMARMVLDALRQATGGQSLPAITDAVAQALGIDLSNDKDRQCFSERVRNTLYRLRDREAVESLRDGLVNVWRIAD